MVKGMPKWFKYFVIIFVVLTGAGFGGFTGSWYLGGLWFLGLIIGAIAGFPLALWWLKRLKALSNKKKNRFVLWLLGTLAGILAGIVCTIILHSTLVLPALPNHATQEFIDPVQDWLWIVLMFGLPTGAGVGLIVGGICSLIYVIKYAPRPVPVFRDMKNFQNTL